MRVESQRRGSNTGGGPPGWALLLAGLVLGVIGGLVYGWVISPVEWTNATPDQLAPGAQTQWVRMTADSYAFAPDDELARRRLEVFDQDELALILGEEITRSQLQGDLAREQRMQQLAQLMNITPGLRRPEAAQPEGMGALGTLLMACGGLLLLVIVLGGAAVLVTRVRQQNGGGARSRPATARSRETVDAVPSSRRGGSQQSRRIAPPDDERDDEHLDEIEDLELEELEEEDVEERPQYGRQRESAGRADEPRVRSVDFAGPQAQPVQYSPALDQYVARYNYGDDGYDVSFSIETAQTEFLGETGVGISDILNDGSPQQVPAFEVWLFDKDDIRTVTKVLLSDYAWNDEELRTRLAPKGELVRVRDGDTLDLETKSLRVRARIREVEYGEGGPGPDSYFERLIIELTPQQKG